MLKKILILVLLASFFSCKNDTNISINSSQNTFSYETVKINIPSKYKKDNFTENRWIDKKTGISLNIELEYSETNLENYFKDSLIMIKKIYPSYKIIKRTKVEKNIISILSTAKVQDVNLKFYMFIISLEKSKIIITIGGREKFFNDEIYDSFVKLIEVNRKN